MDINKALGIITMILCAGFMAFITYLIIFHSYLSTTNTTTCKFYSYFFKKLIIKCILGECLSW